jgi:G patch domain-containing protein 1
MDEEDLREQEEARTLQTTEGFAGFGSTEADATRKAGLMDLLKAGGETMGVKLLKKMGWRDGQGIGPKVRRKADLGDAPGEGPEQTYLFAPENPPMVAFIRKIDHKGLGFEGEARLGERDGSRDEPEESDSFFGGRLAVQGKDKAPKAKEPRRGGIGIGILNDTGSDDEDPYSIGPQISYNRTIGEKKKKKKPKAEEGKPAIASSNPLLNANAKPVFISKKLAASRGAGGFRKCRDGRLPLDGFVLAELSGMSILDKKYEPPQIPEGWKSAKQPASTERDPSSYVSTADAAKASALDPTSRAAVLGEAQLPGKSIFDWMTPEARERIAKLTGNTNLPPALGEKAPKGFELSESQKRKDLWDLVPKLDKQTAVQALTRAVSGWMPYSEDEDKRARYRTFLEVRAEIRDSLPDRVQGSSTDDWVTEMQEFARAAEVFKPMSGIMASRFTSASSGPKVASDAPDSTESALSRPAEKPDPPAVAAAKIGMFGQMTRSTIPFYPARLLCKRFNVKPPANVQQEPGEQPFNAGPGTRFQSGGYQTDSASRELVSQEVMNMIMMESGRQPTASSDAAESGAQTLPKPPPAPAPVVEPERNDALEAERPGDAVFKAIFGSDDED